MSLKSWKEEFYPTPSDSVISRSEAIEHSLQKWRGLAAVNRKRHGVKKLEYQAMLEDEEELFSVNSSTCSLCYLFYDSTELDSCMRCPLYVVRGGHDCDELIPGREKYSPYALWVEKGLATSMIRLLEKARDRFQGS